VTVAYVESSALMKLVVDELESPAMRDAIRNAVRTTSELSLTEVGRGARRRTSDQGVARARAAILRFELIPVNRQILERAASLDPPSLRSLDAIHVASALALETPDVVFYAYDQHTIHAAEANGLAVASPGA
jgi:predicted nucleic acid-binding protein